MTTQIVFQRDTATGDILLDPNGYPLIVANPAANTYGNMQQRIADEVLGAATAVHIANAIQDAIAQYERQTFWFNLTRIYGSQDNLATVNGKEFYSYQDLPVLVVMPNISNIQLVIANVSYPLIERTNTWMNEHSLSQTWHAVPTDYSYSAGSIRLYPIPNGVWPLIIDGTVRYPPLVNASDTNPWLNEAEWLIRCEAKRLLFLHITRDADQAMLMEREILGSPGRPGALSQLRAESMRRSGGMGRLMAAQGYL